MYYSLISSMKRLSDAENFIIAAGITDNTQKLAINNLVDDLKLYGLWTKMKAIYPFVGGNSFSHKFNLKDPRDLNAAFRLTFNGGGTHGLNGYFPNGTNAYAETYLNPNSILTKPFIGYYSRTNANTATDQIDMGAIAGVGLWISAWYNASGFSNFLGRNSSNAVLLVGPAITDSRAWFWTNKVVNTAKLGINTSIVNSSSDTSLPPNINLYIGANNYNNVAGGYTNRECAFSLLADGLTDTDTSNLYILIQKFQTTLGRHVGVPIVSDLDAQAFLNAAFITDITQANAINTLVISLKSAGLWTKMKAIYPFVGGTAFSHKWNLKDPRDLSAAYILNYVGGVTHDSNGINFNGTNAYAETNLNPTLHLTTPSHLSYYTRTNANTNTDQIDLGTIDFWLSLWYKGSGFNNMLGRNQNTAVLLDGGVVTDSRGFGLVTKILNTAKLFKNGIQKDSKTDTVTTYNNATIPIGAFSVNASIKLYYTNRQSAFASIGAGLTDTEAANYYTAVQAFQTTLGRQV